jgi:acyl dehydratase
MSTGLRVAHPSLLTEHVGADLGASDWLRIDQERVAAFAAATDDRQWIHLDADRAATGQFGTTIAHGFLTLSLLTHLCGGLLQVEGTALAINAGSDRVRFVHPVPVGSRIRAVATLADATATQAGVRTRLNVTVEIEHIDRPALVAEILSVYVPA